MRRSWLFSSLLLLAAGPACASEPRLHEVPVGGTVSVAGFGYAEGKRFSADLTFRRIDVYAAGAKVVMPTADGGFVELPRSQRRFFVSDADTTASRVYLSVSADGREYSGALFNAEGGHEFNGRIGPKGLITETTRKVAPPKDGFQCGSDQHYHSPAAEVAPGLDPLHGLDLAKLRVQGGKVATHSMVVAIDTDNELLNLRFGDDTTAATDFIAGLFAGMTLFYERDLNLRLLQGRVVLRPSTTADPYTATSTGEQLNEVGSLWLDTPELFAEDRAFVAFLSGKAPSQFSASGIAWVLGANTNFCTSKGVVQNLQGGGTQTVGHFSATQIFNNPDFGPASSVGIVGHEIGHNFGASHTHCSDRTTGAGRVSTNTIDQCFNGEGGCYSGPLSCPDDNSLPGQGSLMSYCNFSPPSGASCAPNEGQVLAEFHPAHRVLLSARRDTNITNGCFAALAGDVGPTLTPTPGNNSSTNLGGGTVGANVSGNIAFAVSGGSGNGTTSLVCNGTEAVTVTAGSPQNGIAVGGMASNVTARITLTASAQQGTVQCTATAQGGAATPFTFTFTALAGTAPVACTEPCLLRSGFEAGEVAN